MAVIECIPKAFNSDIPLRRWQPHARSERSGPCVAVISGETLVTVIDESGIPSDIEVIGGRGMEICKNRMVKTLAKSRFIPASKDEVSFSSMYVVTLR